jgi:hypothetical protein
MKVAGQGCLGHAEALLREAAPQLLLVGDAFAPDEAKDLSVAECLGCAHLNKIFNRLYIYTAPFREVSNIF